MKDANGKLLVENDQVKEEWRKYKEKLLNEENTWDNSTLEGPCELIRRNESLKALRRRIFISPIAKTLLQHNHNI